MKCRTLLERFVDDARNADRLELQAEFAARNLRDIQEVVDHLVELLHLPIDDIRPSIGCRAGRNSMLRDVGVMDDRERIAELVGEDRQKVVFLLLGRAGALQTT